LKWHISSQPQLSVDLTANTWYNFAYDIDFSGSTVALWYLTGFSTLTQVVGPKVAIRSTNSADFHIGVLRLPNGGTSAAAEDFFWSGIYVKKAPITSVTGPNPGARGSASPPVSSISATTVGTTSVPTTTVSTSTTMTKGSTRDRLSDHSFCFSDHSDQIWSMVS
ncbi:glycoside hydrolase family 131 protein, partial [Sphaerobolus stellatus SS14]